MEKTKRTFQTQKIKISKCKNKSRKCIKSCTIETNYECWTQNLKQNIDRQNLIISKDKIKYVFVPKEKTCIYT